MGADAIFDNFGLIFGVMLVLAIVSTIVGLRTTWLQGTFLGRSKVDVEYDSTPERKSPEARLADLRSLRDSGAIDDAEYQRCRAEVLRDVTDG